MNYYNEFDPSAAAWLRNLISAGLIPEGVVDERSIVDVRPEDLRGYTQCHFFTGIGGWSHALQLAGWPEDRPVWTGSCPCQPFSTAGKQKGKADERHLWPVWFRLISECRPSVVFGEQVAAAVTHEWLDEVATDLESEDYAFGSAIIPACGVGAPHKRDRLWFVASDTFGIRLQGREFRIKECMEEERKRPAEVRFAHQEWDGLENELPQSVLRSSDDGFLSGVVRLRAYGNAIVPQVAAEFIKAVM